MNKHVKENRSNFISSLDRGLLILEAFDLKQPSMGITDIAKKTGLSKSTVFRFVQTLSSLRYIIPLAEGKRYTLGPKVLSLGFSVLSNLELREIAQPYLMELSKQVNETVNLSILDGWKLVYVERIKTQQIVSINLHIGSRLELYNTAMGQVLAAGQSEDWVSQYLNYLRQFPQAKSYWTNKGKKLLRILELVRKRDYAINNEELVPGLRSVASPVRNREGQVVGAINIAVNSNLYPLQKLKQELISPLKKTAQSISASLGLEI
jgi:IclR family pca regulon transcriptional regulator